jgi:hypothetical protein
VPALLLNLRHVPEDEIEEVCELMAEHRIAHYVVPAGPFGLSAGGIWLNESEDQPRAKALLDAYQRERGRLAREALAAAQREGRAETLWIRLRRQPIQVLVMVGVSLFILLIFFAPVVALLRAAG